MFVFCTTYMKTWIAHLSYCFWVSFAQIVDILENAGYQLLRVSRRLLLNHPPKDRSYSLSLLIMWKKERTTFITKTRLIPCYLFCLVAKSLLHLEGKKKKNMIRLQKVLKIVSILITWEMLCNNKYPRVSPLWSRTGSTVLMSLCSVKSLFCLSSTSATSFWISSAKIKQYITFENYSEKKLVVKQFSEKLLVNFTITKKQ